MNRIENLDTRRSCSNQSTVIISGRVSYFGVGLGLNCLLSCSLLLLRPSGVTGAGGTSLFAPATSTAINSRAGSCWLELETEVCVRGISNPAQVRPTAETTHAGAPTVFPLRVARYRARVPSSLRVVAMLRAIPADFCPQQNDGHSLFELGIP